MSTAATTTEWELRLKDYVSAPFKKLTEYATGAQKKLTDVANGLNKAANASNVMGRDYKRSMSGLETTLHNLEKRQRDAFTTKHIKAYQVMINRTKSEMERLNSVTKPNLSGWSKFKNNLKESGSQIPGFGMIANPAVLMGAAVLAVGVGLKKSATLALDYETGMAKINATAQLSTDSLDLLKNRLIEIGSASGGNFELIPDAYEKILSQTGKVNLSLDIMETAVKGAKAGFTDIDTLAAAVGQSLSSIGEQNATASEVLDTFMMAKKVGAGEFKDFAQYLPSLIASGKNLAISYKDTAGMFAFMTGKGQSAADSAMLMNNAFTALQKGPLMEGLQKKGINLFDKAGMRRNISDVFLDLTKRLDGMNDRQKSQFFIDIGLNDAQAKTAFSVLTSDAEKFKETMGDVNDALGETDRQLALTANRARSWGDIGDRIKSWGVAIGDFILPVIDELVKYIDKAAKSMKALFTWKNEDLYTISQTETNIKAARDFADKASSKKFGKEVNSSNLIPGSDSAKFWKKSFKEGMGELNKSSKNNIDTKESAVDLVRENINKGLNADGTLIKEKEKESPSGSSVSGDGNKVRNLTMNLHITNNNKVDDANSLANLKRKIADVIVDAARDGMVTIGV